MQIALDTLGYCQSLAATNGGAGKAAGRSRIFLVPGMAHCDGGPSLDHSGMLTVVVNRVEKNTAPDSVIATGQAFPGRSRPLGAYPGRLKRRCSPSEKGSGVGLPVSAEPNCSGRGRNPAIEVGLSWKVSTKGL